MEKEQGIIWVSHKSKSLKPSRGIKGEISYKYALQYLLRVIEQDVPVYDLLLNLASFATANKLNDKQKVLADKIISYYETRGIL